MFLMACLYRVRAKERQRKRDRYGILHQRDSRRKYELYVPVNSSQTIAEKPEGVWCVQLHTHPSLMILCSFNDAESDELLWKFFMWVSFRYFKSCYVYWSVAKRAVQKHHQIRLQSNASLKALRFSRCSFSSFTGSILRFVKVLSH